MSALQVVPANGPVHLIVDSTGLSIVGEGEWAAAKHGGRGTRGWKKLHLGVDRSGVIVAHALTEGRGRRCDRGRRSDWCDSRRGGQRHGGRRLRHGRVLRGRERAGGGTADTDGDGVSTRTALKCARSRDRRRGDARPAPMEEGLGLPSAGPRGERVLPVQVHPRGWPWSAQSRRPEGRGEPGVPRPESDDRAW